MFLQGLLAGIGLTLIVVTLVKVAMLRATAEMIWQAGETLSPEDERFWSHGHTRGR